MKKRFFSLLLALCMVLTLMPLSVALAADEDQGGDASNTTMTPAVMSGSLTATASVTSARMTLQQLQDKFPDGRYWNGGNVDSTTSSPCPSHATTNYCNCFTSDGSKAWQCYGFALKLGYDAYGTSPRYWNTTANSSYVDFLKPGDIVDNSSSPYHTVFVIGVTDTDIIVGECNYGDRCLIKWGRSIPKSTVKTYSTLKIYIAPSELPIPVVTPEITLSQSSVSMQVGGNATVTLGTKSPGAIYLKAYTSNSSICGGSWGSWNSTGTEMPLTLTGKTVGSATVTVCMYDSNTNAELTRKTISVQVIPVSTAPQVSVETLTTLNSAGTASLYPTVFKGYLRGTSQYNAYSERTQTARVQIISVTFIPLMN